MKIAQKNFTNENFTQVAKPYWDGLQLVISLLKGTGITTSDGINFIDQRHQFIVFFFLQKMYTKYMAEICPGGLLCIEGVNTFEVDGYLMSAPYICPSGSYCQRGC